MKIGITFDVQTGRRSPRRQERNTIGDFHIEIVSCPVMDLKLLPIKLHYFFFFGGMGGVIPFMPVIGKGLGINATAVGIIYTVLPFSIFLSKPFFGYLTDKFQNFRLILFMLIMVTSGSFISVLFLSPLENNKSDVLLECSSTNDLLLHPQQYKKLCLNEVLSQNTFPDVGECGNISTYFVTNISEIPDTPVNKDDSCTSGVRLNKQINCSCIAKRLSSIQDNLTSCLCEREAKTPSIYSTYQFWVFTLLAVVSGSGAATVFCLSDAACYEVLEDQPDIYGKQRLWATISWGLVTFAAGYLNNLSTSTESERDYAPGFYLMVALVLVDLVLLLKIRLTKANISINICKDVQKIFTSYETVIFAIAVYVIGALTGLIWNYEFWFLEDLGATQSLLGLAVAVQCLAAEVPMFFFAGWFIKTFGYFYCVTASFAAFALRYLLYYVLKNPWWVLPIELTHGFSYAIFYASMTGYATDNAPAGTEATMMGILGGLFEGLGNATGSLLGGLGFDRVGGRNTFLVAGVVSLVCTPLLPLSRLLLRQTKSPDEKQGMAVSVEKRYDGRATNSGTAGSIKN